MIAVPQQIGELRGVITELAALRWVWENTPELRDDRVARREVSLRITEAEQLLLRDLAGLTDPRPEPIGSGCLWFYTGLRQKVSSLADVSQLCYQRFLTSFIAKHRKSVMSSLFGEHCPRRPRQQDEI